MAGIGRVGSFVTDTPLAQNHVGQALTDTENQGFLYRKERRDIADAKKKEEEDKNKAIADEFDTFDKTLVPTITGYSSIDDPINMYAMDVKQKGVDWIRQKNQERDPYKKAEIQSRLNKATQSFKLANQFPELLNKKKAELEEGIKNGKYNERDLDAVTQLAKSIDSGKYDMRMDENGVPRITIYNVDENGKPIGVLERGISLGDLTNRITPFQKPTYDINGGIAEQWASEVGLDETVIQNGFVTTTEKQIDQRVKDSAKTRAKEVASMPSEAYELWQKMGNPAKRTFTDAEKQQITDYVENDLLSRVEETYKKDIDQAGALANRKFNKEVQDEAVVISTKPSIIGNNNGVRNGIKLQKNTKDFHIGNAIINLGDGKQKKATNVFVSPGGKIYLETQEIGFKTKTKNEFNLTASGKKKQKEAKKKQGKNFNIKEFYETLESGDYNSVSVSDRTPQTRMLDFGKDGEEIGSYALKMGYKSTKEMQDDFIRRSGGDAFITTPDERPNNGQTRTEISRSELASKAKASGYTTQEYEKLLKAKGITIK